MMTFYRPALIYWAKNLARTRGKTETKVEIYNMAEIKVGVSFPLIRALGTALANFFLLINGRFW